MIFGLKKDISCIVFLDLGYLRRFKIPTDPSNPGNANDRVKCKVELAIMILGIILSEIIPRLDY